MPKNLPDDRLLDEHPMRSVGQPPPLRDDLIAQLQMAVNKAREKRTAQLPKSDRPDRLAKARR